MKAAKLRVCFETDCTVPIPDDLKTGDKRSLSELGWEASASIDEEWRWLKDENIRVEILEIKEVEE